MFNRSGIYIALASAVLYATTVNVIPFAQALGGGAILYLAVRGVCNVLAPVAIDRHTRWSIILATATPKLLLLLLGLLTAAQGFGYVLALHLLPISIATPLFFLFPIFTYLIQKISQRQPLSAVALIALAGSTLGVWLLSQGDEGAVSWLGLASAITAAIAQAIINAMLTRLSQLNPWQILHVAYLPSACVFAGYLLWDLISSTQILVLGAQGGAWGWTLASALIFLFGTALFFVAVKRLGAIRTSNVMYLEPVMAVSLSALLHDDQMTAGKLVAIALILCSTMTLEWFESRARKTDGVSVVDESHQQQDNAR